MMHLDGKGKSNHHVATSTNCSHQPNGEVPAGGAVDPHVTLARSGRPLATTPHQGSWFIDKTTTLQATIHGSHAGSLYAEGGAFCSCIRLGPKKKDESVKQGRRRQQFWLYSDIYFLNCLDGLVCTPWTPLSHSVSEARGGARQPIHPTGFRLQFLRYFTPQKQRTTTTLPPTPITEDLSTMFGSPFTSTSPSPARSPSSTPSIPHRNPSFFTYSDPLSPTVHVARDRESIIATQSPTDIIPAVIRITSASLQQNPHAISPSISHGEDLPTRPARRPYLSRLKTRFPGQRRSSSSHTRDEFILVKMPRGEYQRYFARDGNGGYAGSEPERTWTVEEVEGRFGACEDRWRA